jgi:hypothetical protein
MTEDLLRVPRSAHPEPTRPRLRSRRVPLGAYAGVLLSSSVDARGRERPGLVRHHRAGATLAARPVAAAPAPAATAAPSDAATPSAGTTRTPSPTGSGTPKSTGTGEPGQEKAAPTSGASPDDVKGWMSVQQVLDAFPVSQADLYARFAIPAGTATSATLSELAESSGGGFDVPALREWLGEASG